MTEKRLSASPLDQIDEAVDAVEAQEDQKVIRAAFILGSGRKVSIEAPHPLTADDFESIIVVLLKMRAESEARAEAERPIATLPPTVLLAPDGRKLSAVPRKSDA